MWFLRLRFKGKTHEIWSASDSDKRKTEEKVHTNFSPRRDSATRESRQRGCHDRERVISAEGTLGGAEKGGDLSPDEDCDS